MTRGDGASEGEVEANGVTRISLPQTAKDRPRVSNNCYSGYDHEGFYSLHWSVSTDLITDTRSDFLT